MQGSGARQCHARTKRAQGRGMTRRALLRSFKRSQLVFKLGLDIDAVRNPRR